MSIGEFERRLVELERTVGDLKARVEEGGGTMRPWWRTDAGRFRDDPAFEEIARLGAEYRRSLEPVEAEEEESRRDRP